MEEIMFVEILFLTFGLFYLLTPLLALKVKKRFIDLGYEMKCNPYFSILNISFFWYEAHNKNKSLKDIYIRNYIIIYYTILFAFIISLVAMMIAD